MELLDHFELLTVREICKRSMESAVWDLLLISLTVRFMDPGINDRLTTIIHRQMGSILVGL